MKKSTFSTKDMLVCEKIKFLISFNTLFDFLSLKISFREKAFETLNFIVSVIFKFYFYKKSYFLKSYI